MGLEMLQMQNKLIENIRENAGTLEETKVRLLFGVMAIFLYLLIGSLVLVRIESPVEKIHVEAYEEFRAEWTARLRRKGFKEADIDKLFANIRDSALNGIWRENNVSSDLNWTFGRSFFFAATLITTIGYGNVSPRTPHGKLFTIVYCVVGIPLTLAFISAFAMRLRSRQSQWMRDRVNITFGQSFHAKHLQLIHLAVLGGFVLIFVFVIPSLIFKTVEDDWTFIDAFFFCFVSLSTIGLGDYVPGSQPNQPYRSLYSMFVAIYLIFGLCCMMLLLNTLYDLPQFNLIRLFVVSNPSPPLTDQKAKNGTELSGGTAHGSDYGGVNQSHSNYSIGETNPFNNPFTAPNTSINSNQTGNEFIGQTPMMSVNPSYNNYYYQ